MIGETDDAETSKSAESNSTETGNTESENTEVESTPRFHLACVFWLRTLCIFSKR